MESHNKKKLTTQQHEVVQALLKKYPLISNFITNLQAKGENKKAYLVGGIVRDIIMGLPLEKVDIDIEVHGVTIDELAELLSPFGVVNYVGKSFGVLKVGSVDIDWVLPRVDSAGRKPEVKVVDLPIEEALRRRDVTMNAMALDLSSGDLYDPFGGVEDIQNKILRSPDPAFFTEDPLRFYRVMQFIGRFEMYPDATLQNVCKTMDIASISRERIEMEFHKLFLKSRQPSKGIRWLADLGRIVQVLPEVAQLQGVEQDPVWHPEGDVFEHTMQALDAAAFESYANTPEKLLVMYAALCHDLGKKVAMQRDGDRIHNYGHEQESVPLARQLLHRIVTNKSLIHDVCVLVLYHMQPGQLVKNNASLAAYKRLARKIAPLSLQTLSLLAYADNRGRNPERNKPLSGAIERVEQFIVRAQEAGVYRQPEPPLLLGADLLDQVEPGPELGKILAKAYQIQIDEGISDKEILKKRVINKRKS